MPRCMIECVQRAEHVVNCSEKDAANAAELTGTALSCSEKIINNDVNGSKFPDRVQERIKGSWDRQGRNQGSCWLAAWWVQCRHQIRRRRFCCCRGDKNNRSQLQPPDTTEKQT